MKRLVRFAGCGVLAAVLVLATSGLGFASCADDDTDGSLVAAARLTAEQNCCLTNDAGDVTCKTKRSELCTGVVGACGSCCDACGGGTGPTCPIE